MSDGTVEAATPSGGNTLGSLRALPFAPATRLALALAIVFAVCGSGSLPTLVSIGLPLRWVALAAFTFSALGWMVVERGLVWDGVRAAAPVLLLALLGLVSAAWSVSFATSAERAVAFGCLAVGVAAAASATKGAPRKAELLVEAVVLAALVVCLLGPILYAINPTRTVDQSTYGSGFRFAGMGQSANTVAMLAAVAVPLSVWLAVVKHKAGRVFYVAACVVACSQVVASGSRGAALAVCVGAVVLALLLPARRNVRAGLLMAALAVSVAIFGINRLVQYETTPPLAAPTSSSPAPAAATPAPLPKIILPPMQDELGGRPKGGRALFGNDGRALALQEAFDQGSERPLVGWGFGTETQVYFERSSLFVSSRPEDSFLSLYLELGIGGVLLWLLAGGLVLAGVIRSRRRDARLRWAMAGLGATTATAFALGIGQSYVYSTGNVATLSVWLVAALATMIGFGSGGSRAPRWVPVAGVLLLLAVPVGLWEGGHARRVQNAGIENVWKAVGSRLAAPNLDGFRVAPPLSCLLYDAGGSPAGYELCFNGGHAVQAIDRRNGYFRAWRVSPFGRGAAAVRVPGAAVEAQLRRLGAYKPGLQIGFAYQARRVG